MSNKNPYEDIINGEGSPAGSGYYTDNAKKYPSPFKEEGNAIDPTKVIEDEQLQIEES